MARIRIRCPKSNTTVLMKSDFGMESVLIIAGENSGEKYGAALIQCFLQRNPALHFFGIGGRYMEEAGTELLFHINDLSVVGATEIIFQIPRLLHIFNQLRREIRRRRPLAAVLIDSPDFNLRLAGVLHRLKIPVLYYVSPTVWAWRPGRLKTIKKYVDKMMLIFPFEKDIYARNHIPASYIGHPLKERIRLHLSEQQFRDKYAIESDRRLLMLLPGSRKSEIQHHMPILMEALIHLRSERSFQPLLLQAENLEPEYLRRFLPPGFEDLRFLSQDGYEAMAYSDLVFSSCGTANLESALLGTPFIAFYRISPLTYRLGIKHVRIQNYSIVNILAGEKIVPELIQDDFTPENLIREAHNILSRPERRIAMLDHFKRIDGLLGNEPASKNAARELEYLIAGGRSPESEE